MYIYIYAGTIENLVKHHTTRKQHNRNDVNDDTHNCSWLMTFFLPLHDLAIPLLNTVSFQNLTVALRCLLVHFGHVRINLLNI
mmetsp:Transcript_43473/g.75069  ORF Transcript_43473/g.75069 Transcript_43473/m.75069 type:complete len:83 (+) Transcript_43473:109-357(+)